jgi:uncharacterized cupin superfamily protein
MNMILIKQSEITPKHESHGEYEYFKRLVLPKTGNQCTVAFMEIPPSKAAFPSHYHVGITEVFYIISGVGRLETAEGDKSVTAGDVGELIMLHADIPARRGGVPQNLERIGERAFALSGCGHHKRPGCGVLPAVG